jgi:TolB-like protein/DNA-binding winged helix-turn-helix (wHTH) protein
MGDWLVEPDLDRISRYGETTSIRPQVMDLLVYLSSRPGVIISPDEILAEVWCGRVTTYASVYNCLKELRRALGDDPHDPGYIETIPKRGYRLIAEISPVSASGEPGTAESRKPPRFKSSHLVLSTISILLAVIIVTGAILIRSSGQPNPAFAVPERSIAVLPFRDISPAGDQDYFAEGVTEEILNELGKLPQLRVTAKNSAFSFRDTQEDIQTIGSKLGVAYILKGSVRKDATEVRVTTQLTDTRDGFQVWSEEYSHAPNGIFIIQDDIGDRVASALKASIMSNTLSDEVDGRNSDPAFDVYDRYLLARSLMNQSDKESLQEAIDLLHQVIAEEPDFTRARILLHDAQLTLYWEFNKIYDPREPADSLPVPERWLDNLEERIQTVLINQPQSAEIHLLWGRLMRLRRQYDLAETALNKALEINPSLAEAHRNLGLVYVTRLSSYNRVIDSFRQAAMLDPYSKWARLNLAAMLAGIPEAEEEMWRVLRAAKLNLPWSPRMGRTEAGVLSNLGRYAEAIQVLEDAIERKDYPGLKEELANIWYFLGEVNRARALVADFELYRDDPFNPDLPDWQRCPGNPDNDSKLNVYVRGYVCMMNRGTLRGLCQHRTAGAGHPHGEWKNSLLASRPV